MLAEIKLRKDVAPSVITYWMVCKPHSKGRATIFSVSDLISHTSMYIHKTVEEGERREEKVSEDERRC